MANKTIGQLTADTQLTGVELVPVFQDGSTFKTSVQDIANFANAIGNNSGINLDVQTALNTKQTVLTTELVVKFWQSGEDSIPDGMTDGDYWYLPATNGLKTQTNGVISNVEKRTDTIYIYNEARYIYTGTVMLLLSDTTDKQMSLNGVKTITWWQDTEPVSPVGYGKIWYNPGNGDTVLPFLKRWVTSYWQNYGGQVDGDPINGHAIYNYLGDRYIFVASAFGGFMLMISQTSTKVDIANIANNLITETSGKVLDARQGKILSDAITGAGSAGAVLLAPPSGSQEIVSNITITGTLTAQSTLIAENHFRGGWGNDDLINATVSGFYMVTAGGALPTESGQNRGVVEITACRSTTGVSYYQHTFTASNGVTYVRDNKLGTFGNWTSTTGNLDTQLAAKVNRFAAPYMSQYSEFINPTKAQLELLMMHGISFSGGSYDSGSYAGIYIASMYGGNFVSANFSGAFLTSCTGMNFIACSFANATVESLSNVSLSDSNLTGTQLNSCNFTNSSFQSCSFDGATRFAGCNLTNATFEGTVLPGYMIEFLYGCTLYNTSFLYCDARGLSINVALPIVDAGGGSNNWTLVTWVDGTVYHNNGTTWVV